MLDDTTQEAPVSNEAQQAGLGVVDLRVLKEVVDVASARGAFKADEFATIGETYSRLNIFLQTIDAANAAQVDGITDDEASTDTDSDADAEDSADTNTDTDADDTEE